MTTLLKKIGAGDLLGHVAKIVREEFKVNEQKPAFGVAGFCNKIEKGTSQFGDWTRFIGDFQAVNYLTGEQFRSEKTHVPSVLEAVLLRDLERLMGSTRALQHTEVTDLTGEIEFAFTVAIKRVEDKADGGVNWEYITTPKTEIKANNRISHLSAMLQLDAPKAEVVEIQEQEKPAKTGKAK